MNITISGRHLEVTPAMHSHAQEKAGKLPKYYDAIQEIEIILDGTNGKSRKVEMIVHAEHKNMFVATAEGEDLYGCIDQVSHNLQRQLTDHKERFRNRKHTTE